MSSNLINRIESSVSFKDVKYLIYREVWKWRQARHFKEMCRYIKWDNNYNCWMSKNGGFHAYNWRYYNTENLFNMKLFRKPLLNSYIKVPLPRHYL